MLKIVQKYTHKLWFAFKSIIVYKNWFAIYLYYLKLFKKSHFTMELRGGVQFKIRPRQKTVTDSYIVHEIWLYGVHNALKPYLQSAKVGIEIGAHIGVFSVFAAHQAPSLRLYAYEPAPNNLELLQENISLNGFEGRIIPQPYAVCGTTGKREFYLPEDSGLYSLDEKYAQSWGEYGKITVECQTLEDVFRVNNIDFCDFIKMDCEGGEYEILYSTPKDILEKIGVMSIEYHKGGDVNELRVFLESNNFSVSFSHKRLDVLLAVNNSLYSTARQTSPMRILQTAEFYDPHIGGVEGVVKQLSERLVKKGHEVTVATTCLPERKQRLINGVRIEEFCIRGNTIKGIKGKKKEIERYKRFIREGDFDIVHNHAAQAWPTDLAFDVLDKIKSKKIFTPVGYSRFKDHRYKKYFEALPDYLKRYDKLIYMSTHYQDKVFGDKHGLRDKAVIIPNGASGDEFLLPDSFKIRQELNIKTPYLLICVASHYFAKGHNFIISAFRRMKRRDATLLIIGEPIVSSGLKRLGHFILDYLNCFLASLFDKNIKLVDGRNRNVVLSAYKNADLFLFGSHVKCAPLVMYESFASKTPFITTDVGNVKDHKDVLKIVKTPEEMAEIANRLLNNEAKRTSMADRAFNLWKKNHTWETIAYQYEKLYRSLIE